MKTMRVLHMTHGKVTQSDKNGFIFEQSER